MNAPTPSAAVAINQTIAIELLSPSPINPRKRFDEAKLKELAESIKTQGVLQPLLVRETKAQAKSPAAASWPFPTKGEPDNRLRYEIVAGERRYRAAKLAKLAGLPCFVRELTDLQVLHAQVIENLQRDDLHPLEEAEGYERLIELGSKAEELGAEIGKSRAYIYGRLKLCALVSEAREAFYDGKLDASTALLIARIPVAKLQIQALKKVTLTMNYGNAFMATGDAMSYRAARDLIRQEFMTDLDRAPFPIKDAALLTKAGSCTDCVKRTGNQPELFDDVSSKDVCTDTSCFAMKKTAHILAIQKKAEDEGCMVITGKKAKEIIKNPSWSNKPEPVPENGTAAPDVQKVMVENTHTHELIPTVNIEQAVKVLREAGMEITLKGAAVKKPSLQQDTAALQAKIDQINTARTRLFDALHQKIEADMGPPEFYFAPGLYRLIAERVYENADYRNRLLIAKRYMPGAIISKKNRHEDERKLRDAFEESIAAMTTQQHVLLLIDLMMIDDIQVDQWSLKIKPETMLSIAAEIGIDAAAITEVKAAQKAAAKPASTPTAAAPAAKKSAQKKKAAQAPEAIAWWQRMEGLENEHQGQKRKNQ